MTCNSLEHATIFLIFLLSFVSKYDIECDAVVQCSPTQLFVSAEVNATRRIKFIILFVGNRPRRIKLFLFVGILDK